MEPSQTSEKVRHGADSLQARTFQIMLLPQEYRSGGSPLPVIPQRHSQRFRRCERRKFSTRPKGRSGVSTRVLRWHRMQKGKLGREPYAPRGVPTGLCTRSGLGCRFVAGEHDPAAVTYKNAAPAPHGRRSGTLCGKEARCYSAGASSLGASDEWCARSGPLGAW